MRMYDFCQQGQTQTSRQIPHEIASAQPRTSVCVCARAHTHACIHVCACTHISTLHTYIHRREGERKERAGERESERESEAESEREKFF